MRGTAGLAIHRESRYKHQLPKAPEDGKLPCVRDQELFQSSRPEEVLAAKYRCGTCPIQRECLDGALARGEHVGVWGGFVFHQGKVLGSRKRAA